MRDAILRYRVFVLFAFVTFLSSCASMSSNSPSGQPSSASGQPYASRGDFASRLPQHISSTEKTILVDPNVHAWGAYENGSLVKAGLAAAGADYCPDLHHRCHTSSGTFRIFSLGNEDCKSSIFPMPRGGAPMPYCMYFSHGEALHGSYELADANISHGCVRMEVGDAEWLRYNFATIGTKVIVKPY